MKKCARCGDKEAEINSHHIIPRSMGGKDSQDNRVDLCIYCHKEWHLVEKFFVVPFHEWVATVPSVKCCRSVRSIGLNLTQQALEKLRREGKPYTGIVPYGTKLDSGKYIPDPVELRHIAQMRKLRENHNYSYQQIADTLNETKVPTRKGNIWAKKTVQGIIERSKRLQEVV